VNKTEDFIRKARLKLSSAKYRFFGLCLYPIRTIHSNDERPIEGWINYEVDGEKFENQIHINERVINENIDRYKTTNMIDIMLHELNHIIRRHDIRRGDRNPNIWNVACNHVIDLSLRNLNLSKPIYSWSIIDRIAHKSPKQSEEEVYRWLMKNKKNDSGDGVSITQGSGDIIKVDDDSYSTHFEIQPDLKPQEITSEEKQVVEDYVSQIRAVYNIEKEKGYISSDLTSIFDELLKVEIPWETLLEKAIKAKTTEKANRRSWRKLNKFYVNLNISLPGFVPSREQDAVSTLIVHIDSSGSVDNKNLRKAGYVITKSAQHFDKVILIIADVNIKQEVTFNKWDYNKITDYFKEEGVRGRGGTSHKHVFNYFDKYYEENSDNLSLCISITDMYSDIERYIDKSEFIKAIPLILINTSNNKIIKMKNITTIICN
jgi:predicted metal-dependent peptidase